MCFYREKVIWDVKVQVMASVLVFIKTSWSSCRTVFVILILASFFFPRLYPWGNENAGEKEYVKSKTDFVTFHSVTLGFSPPKVEEDRTNQKRKNPMNKIKLTVAPFQVKLVNATDMNKSSKSEEQAKQYQSKLGEKLQLYKLKNETRKEEIGPAWIKSSPGKYLRFPHNFEKVGVILYSNLLTSSNPLLTQLKDDERSTYLSVQHFPWFSSSISSCRNFSTKLSRPGTHSSPIALASIPSSGNTWVRSIIEDTTGKFTGSMYKVSRWQIDITWNIGLFCPGQKIVWQRILWWAAAMEQRGDFGYQDTWLQYWWCKEV